MGIILAISAMRAVLRLDVEARRWSTSDVGNFGEVGVLTDFWGVSRKGSRAVRRVEVRSS